MKIVTAIIFIRSGPIKNIKIEQKVRANNIGDLFLKSKKVRMNKIDTFNSEVKLPDNQ